MSALNVRSLISRFEQLTTGFENNQPKTPITPKLTSRQFFPETISYVQKNNNTKLLKIETQILAIKEQIQAIEEVSNDEFVKILFLLLNLLIELGAIDADGNYNIKRTKTQCFNAIIECKDSLVQCLDEEFAVENGISVSYGNEYEKPITPSEKREEENIPNEPSVFAAVSQMKNFFENKAKDETPPKPSMSVLIEPTSNVLKYSTQVASNIDEPKSPKKSTDSENSEISEPETVISKEVFDRYASQRSLYESTSEIKLNSVKKMKDLFETKSTGDITKARSSTTLDKLIHTLDLETESTSASEEDDDNLQTVTPITKEETSLDKQKALMDTLVAELDYYKSLIESMDPTDDVRAEVLEENLVEMFLEINKVQTFEDVELSKQKEAAIKSAQFLQTKINENKTNIGHYMTNLEDSEGSNEPTLPPTENFEAILSEVERYKELVDSFEPTKNEEPGRFLEENICEVLLLLDNYDPVDDTEKGRKMRAIKDLGLVLNELNQKKSDTKRHYMPICPQSPNQHNSELVSDDDDFKNHIAVCPAAPLGYQPSTEIENELKGQYSELSLANFKQPVDDNDNFEQQFDEMVMDNLAVAEDEIELQFNKVIKKNLLVNDDDVTSEQQFNKPGKENLIVDNNNMVEQKSNAPVEENMDVDAKNILVAASHLKDVCVEVNIFKNILEELQIFDREELEIFKKNVAEIEDILLQLECYGDPKIESQKKETLQAVREIQERLDTFVKPE